MTFRGSRAPVGRLLDRQSVCLLGDNLTTARGNKGDAGVTNPQDVFEVYKQNHPKKLLSGGCRVTVIPSQTSCTRHFLLDPASAI